MEHYIKSSRKSKSGYQYVGTAGSDRPESWRVKMDGTTIGRYNLKAQACEEAYWLHKQAKEMKEFGNDDSFPSAMFD